MAQRTNSGSQRVGGSRGDGGRRPGGQGGDAARGGGSGRRPRAAPVKKPFPWGFAVGATVLAVLLAVVLGYAVKNAGSAAPSPLKDADKTVKGIQVASGTLSRVHKDGPLPYPQSPPVGGTHNQIWENCAIYTVPVPNEHAVHSLEHGAVWITYRPDLAPDQLKILTALAQADPKRLLSPYPGLKTPISIQAWGRQLFVSSATDPRLAKFADEFTDGPQTPERGASCSGGTSVTGSTPTTAAASVPAPAPSR